jgi:hypothetical protein
MNYPIGYPFSKLVAKLGFNLIVRVDIIFDEEAKVFVATSKDVDGLVLEAENFSDLTLEVKEAITTLMTLNKQNPVHNADLIYKNHIALA